MHESALQWNAINVINLLEISGANELSFLCVIFGSPYIFHNKNVSPFLFHDCLIAVSSYMWAKLQFLG